MFGLNRKYNEEIQRLERINDLIEAAETELRYTPDASFLDRKLHHLVFFCDGHMRSRHDHDLMKEFEFKGTVFTHQRYYHWKRNLGFHSFTIPILAEDNAKTLDFGTSSPVLANPARIKGELYLLDTKAVKSLDLFRENGVQFTRRRSSFLMPVKVVDWVKERSLLENKLNEVLPTAYVTNNRVEIVKAWIYEANSSFWSDQLDGGYSYSPVKIFKPRRNLFGNYSFFTNLEYEHTPTYNSETKQEL